MFSNIIGVLQGPAIEATDEATGTEPETHDAARTNQQQSKHDIRSTASSGTALSFWNVANALAESVKKTTADISASVAETDWRAELEAFGKGVADDAGEVQRHAQAAAKESALKLEKLPEQAAKARLPTVDGTKVKSQFDQVGLSLGRFGNKMLASSKELFEQVTEAVQSELDGVDSNTSKPKKTRAARQAQKNAPKYNRLEAEISTMQRNSSTYCDQPEDADDFAAWLQDFKLDLKKADIEAITKENAFMAELQSRIVPLIVQYEVFWTRYFYQLEKLKQKHEQRQNVAQLAAQAPGEPVAWDDEEEHEPVSKAAPSLPQSAEQAAGQLKEVDPSYPQTPQRAVSAEDLPSEAAAPAPAKAKEAEEELETSTASDDSSVHPWTVVTSPTHKRVSSSEADSKPAPAAPPASLPAAQVTPQDARGGLMAGAESVPRDIRQLPRMQEEVAPRATEDGEAGDELDIEVSEEEGGTKGGSEVDEDWGTWD